MPLRLPLTFPLRFSNSLTETVEQTVTLSATVTTKHTTTINGSVDVGVTFTAYWDIVSTLNAGIMMLPSLIELDYDVEIV
jgi:hypothetical protein